MLPVVALVGRPNVGKSTLFNRLTRSRDALVANLSGLTRDRRYGNAIFEQREFIVVDTGGIVREEQGIDAETARQSHLAIEQADVVLLLVDLREGSLPADHAITTELRRAGKLVLLVANKMDGLDADAAVADFYALGISPVITISASHGRGIQQLQQHIVAALPAVVETPVSAEKGLKMAIIGRPNVGKSTLVNRLLGGERVVVYDEPGTTRDSVVIPYERAGKPYVLIDTAGVRRRKNVRDAVEKFSIIKALQAIQDCNVAVLLIDAQEGVVDQDLHMLGAAMDAGRGLVIAINKWDGLESTQKDFVKRELERRLQFIDYADVHYISALYGSGVGNLYKSIDKAYDAATRSLSTNKLNQILAYAVAEVAPPMAKGRRIKLRYAHAGGSNPPIIVIHGNQTEAVPANYTRYLEKVFRRKLSLAGTPIRIEFRCGDNPYAGRKNKLSPRRAAKKRKLVGRAKP
ncbi:MAG: ribosome biogenesis GTPase Der [Pseudomonadales bacterium]